MICSTCSAENEDGTETCFTCGRPLGGAAITRGTVIAQRYEILSPLGRGGMGMVYKSHDRVLDETVALKVLRAEIAGDPDMARRFRNEIRLARRIRHKNVCGIHEYGEDGPIHFIAMEFIDGVDLKRILKRYPDGLPTEEAFDVAIQVARGLQAIHDCGIIHRDLKTPNIMRDAKGLIRLMDFGIAKEEGATSGQTATGLIVGTPEYMSPEQARGQKVDSRTDIYALGIVIFEIFTGEVPFHGDTPLATILKHLKDPPPVEVMEAHHLPEAVRGVLLKSLAKEPVDRFATADDVIEALREARAAALPGTQPTPLGLPAVSEPVWDEDLESRSSAPTPAPAATPAPRTAPTVAARRPAPPEPRTAVVTPRPAAPRPPRATQASPRSEPARRSSATWLILLPVGAAALAIGVFLGLRKGTPAPATQAPAPSATAVIALGAETPTSPATALPAPPSPSVAVNAATIPPPSIVPTPSPESRRSIPELPRASPEPPRSPTPAAATPRATLPTPLAGRASPPPAALPTLPLVRTTTSPAPTPAPEKRSPRPTVTEPGGQTEAEAKGELQVVVVPWAEVAVDGTSMGTTPLRKIPLSAGSHSVVFTHPNYHPLRRKVTIVAGQTSKLTADLTQDAVPKR